MSALVMQATKGRLYGGPVDGPLAAVARIGGQCRALWNLFLAESRDRYAAEGKFVFYAEMSARLPALLKSDPRLIGLPHRAAQMTVQKLDRALRDCVKARGGARKGFPRFKRHSDRQDAFSFVGREVRLEPGRIRLPKIGWLRVRGLWLPEGADLKQVAVTQEPRGWHVSIQFEAAAKSYATPTLPAVGIDAGLSALLTLSDERKVVPPRLARKAAGRIRRLNRERDRRRKGSVNRRRTVERLARTHRKVRQKRIDHMHKITRELVDTHQGFAVETLSLMGLARTRMAKSFADAGLGELLRTLRYKAEWAGRAWCEMPRFQRSTGVCPDCGAAGPRLPLSVREWTCETCGAVHDRDVAAARIILARAVGQALPEPAGAVRRKRGAVGGAGARPPGRARRAEPPTNVAEVVHG
jgi:putative transposase